MCNLYTGSFKNGYPVIIDLKSSPLAYFIELKVEIGGAVGDVCRHGGLCSSVGKK